MEQKVKITADVADLGRVQNAVQGANSSLSALGRLVQGDFVGAMQQGTAGVRQLWRSISAIPSGGPIVALGAAGVAAIKAWEMATDRQLSKTQALVAAWKELQTVFHRAMGWNLTPTQRLEQSVAQQMKYGASARDIGGQLTMAEMKEREARQNLIDSRAAADQPIFKPAEFNARKGTLFEKPVLDDAAMESARRRSQEAAVAFTQASEAVTVLRKAYDEVAELERNQAAEKRKAAAEAASAASDEAAAARSARESSARALQENGMSQRDLQRKRSDEARIAMQEAVKLPPGAARDRAVARAYDLEGQSRDFGRAADASDRAEKERKAEEEKRRAAELAQAAEEARRITEIDPLAVMRDSISRGTVGRATRSARVMAGSGMGGFVQSGNLTAGITAPGPALQAVPRTPEQEQLKGIRTAIEEQTKLLKERLGLP